MIYDSVQYYGGTRSNPRVDDRRATSEETSEETTSHTRLTVMRDPRVTVGLLVHNGFFSQVLRQNLSNVTDQHLFSLFEDESYIHGFKPCKTLFTVQVPLRRWLPVVHAVRYIGMTLAHVQVFDSIAVSATEELYP